MDRKIWLLIPICVGFALWLGPACGSGNSNSSDDDDDFSPLTLDCQEIYDTIYNTCGISFVDSQGNRLSENQVVDECNAGESPYGLDGPYAQCVVHDNTTCDTLQTCLSAATSG
jgi:hypothetical protein